MSFPEFQPGDTGVLQKMLNSAVHTVHPDHIKRPSNYLEGLTADVIEVLPIGSIVISGEYRAKMIENGYRVTPAIGGSLIIRYDQIRRLSNPDNDKTKETEKPICETEE